MGVTTDTLMAIFCLDLRSKQEPHYNCSMMPTFWLQADTMLTALATQNCSARLYRVNSSSLEDCYLEKQDMGKLSLHCGST